MVTQMRLDTFARHLALIASDMQNLERRGMEDAGRMLRAAARGYLGEYQPAIRGFPAWKQLADATLYGGVSATGHYFKGKIELGYATESDHNPLVREGDLRRSIDFTVAGRRLLLGSTSLVGLWQELGTVTIPPRSFLGRAMAEHGRDATRIIGERVFRPLITGRRS